MLLSSPPFLGHQPAAPATNWPLTICFLAYVLWKTLAHWMQRSGLGDAPRTLLDELAKIRSGDVVLPTKTTTGDRGPTVQLRCVTEPDAAQKVLFNRLGLTLPRRLRYQAAGDEV